MIKNSNQSLLIDPIKKKGFFSVIYICILISREGELVGPIQPLLVQFIQPLLVQYIQPLLVQYIQPLLIQYIQPLLVQYIQPLLVQYIQPLLLPTDNSTYSPQILVFNSSLDILHKAPVDQAKGC